MIKKLLILTMISVTLIGCNKVEETPLEEPSINEGNSSASISDGDIPVQELSSLSLNDIPEEQEEVVIEEVPKDGINFYDYGYKIPIGINIKVNENKYEIYDNENNVSDKYKVYYWVDKNTRILDSTSMELKEGIQSIIHTGESIDNRWEYILIVNSDGTFVNSSYDARIIKVDYIKDGEKLVKKFVLCIPNESLFFRGAQESKEEEISNILTVSYNNENVNLNFDNLIFGDDISEQVDGETFSTFVIDYEYLFKEYDCYNSLLSFLNGSKVSTSIKESVVTPLDEESLNEVILSTISYDSTLYLKSKEEGFKYYYVIFSSDEDTYETIVISDKDVNINELDFKSYVNKEEDVLMFEKDDSKISWLSWSTFYNNEDLSNTAIKFIKEITNE